MIPGFGPATEVLFLREKDPKPLAPRQASLDGSDANLRRADQLAALKQGLLNAQSVRPLSLSAGVGQGKERKFSGFSQTKFQGSTSGSTDAKIRLRRSGHNKNSLALWHGRAVQPTPGKMCAVFERSKFARRRCRRTAQGTRRATTRSTWFWLLLTKQKWLVLRGETRQMPRWIPDNKCRE